MSFATFLIRHSAIPESQVTQSTMGGPLDSINAKKQRDFQLLSQSQDPYSSRCAELSLNYCYGTQPAVPRHLADLSHPQLSGTKSDRNNPPRSSLFWKAIGDKVYVSLGMTLEDVHSRYQPQKESIAHQAPGTSQIIQSDIFPGLWRANHCQRHLPAVGPVRESHEFTQHSSTPRPKRRASDSNVQQDPSRGSHYHFHPKNGLRQEQVVAKSPEASTGSSIAKSFRVINRGSSSTAQNTRGPEHLDANEEARQHGPKLSKQPYHNIEQRPASCNAFQPPQEVCPQLVSSSRSSRKRRMVSGQPLRTELPRYRSGQSLTPQPKRNKKSKTIGERRHKKRPTEEKVGQSAKQIASGLSDESCMRRGASARNDLRSAKRRLEESIGEQGPAGKQVTNLSNTVRDCTDSVGRVIANHTKKQCYKEPPITLRMVAPEQTKQFHITPRLSAPQNTEPRSTKTRRTVSRHTAQQQKEPQRKTP